MQVTIATVKSLLEGELSQQQVEAMRRVVGSFKERFHTHV